MSAGPTGVLSPPPEASDIAPRVDSLFGFTLVYSVFFTLLIAGLLFAFGLKYRRGRQTGEVARSRRASAWLEIVWSVVPLGIMLITYGWGARVYLDMARPPAGADEYFVVARQWMWKVQHPEGPREINELHVPVGRAIKLTMTSEDVIHSFYVPAFRMKMDVLPNRTTTEWFRAKKPGVYHLFCAEYCGTNHSAMIGRVVVMEPLDYERWLSGGGAEQKPVDRGEAAFLSHGCATCHRPDTAARAPILTGLFGRKVQLASGGEVVADDAYVRESILRPAAKVVKGYSAIMPPYEGRISGEDLLLLIAHVKSMGQGGAKAGEPSAPEGKGQSR
ncbi:MAG: cytochrome c oxidase subunit II [Polyangiaceae bacterium]